MALTETPGQQGAPGPGDDGPAGGAKAPPPGRRRTGVLAAVAAVVVVAIAAGVVLARDTSDTGVSTAGAAGGSSTIAGFDTGVVVPADVVFERFEDGPVTFGELRGTPAVLNFWASWCPACVSEMPDFESVHRDLGDEVAFVGFDVQDTREAAVSLAEETGVSYTLADDTDGAFHRAFGAFAMPATVFLAADGTVVDVHNGILTETQLLDRVATLMEAS